MSFSDLKPKHKMVLRLYASGRSPLDIATQMNISIGTVYQIVNTPTAKAFLQSVTSELDVELKMLKSKFVETIRNCLDTPDPRVQLAGASLYQKWLEKDSAASVVTHQTAEDLVKIMMEHKDIEQKPTNLITHDFKPKVINGN